jgi:hypothetical protein
MSTVATTATITADATVGALPKSVDAAPTFTATFTATGHGARPAASTLTLAATITAEASCIRAATASLPVAAQLTASAFIGVELIGMDSGTTTAQLLSGTAYPGPLPDVGSSIGSTMDLARSTVSSLG